MSDFGFNTDNQVTSVMSLTNPVYDGSGNPTAFSSPASTPSSLQFGGSAPYDAASASFAFDSENRLVGISSSSPSPAVSFSALYDGAGVREIKTTAADGTVYFLLDASGAPVVEETYTGTTASFGTISAFGPDGLRSRYTVSDNSETAFFYDPQGTLVNRISSVDSGVAVNGEPMTDVCVWDGYGQQRTDQWSPKRGDAQYTPNDPVGFEGQAGYYADWELAQEQTLGSNQTNWVFLTTTPSLLTHRYYDASTGRFVNRDPIGYGGGANLYGYCGGNPVNRKDANGTASDKVSLGPGQYYVELDAFIPDLSVAVAGMIFKGDNRRADPSKPSARAFEGFVIDTTSGKVYEADKGTGDTHEIGGFLSPWSGNSDKLGRTLWSSTASRDGAGNFTVHFDAVSANPRIYSELEPPIAYDITLKFDASGDLKSATGFHTAFPGFEIYEYGGKSPKALYVWDPHNVFDLWYRSHANYIPETGLPNLVNLNGSIHGVNTYVY